MKDGCPDPDRSPYITTYKSIGGWKAVRMWWNPEGFWEPFETGIGAHCNDAQAELEALEWAANAGVRYVKRSDAID